LIEQREEIKKLTDEAFEVQKKSVYTKISEKDYNLRQEMGRFGSEISTHQYNFERQTQELAELEKISKADFQALFEKVFFSEESKRLDVNLTAEIHKEENAEYSKKNSESEIFK